jgi:hypothetical protein
MLKDISYSPSCNHSRLRAQTPGTTLEQLITVGSPVCNKREALSAIEQPFATLER